MYIFAISGVVPVSDIPGVFLDANLFRNREGEDEDDAHEKKGEALVCIPVIRHLHLAGPSHSIIQGYTH